MIDLRSDTFTKPTDAMRSAMASAEVGDDVFGEDPTVNALQDHVAALLGKEAGLFLASGTQSNLCGILAHCQRGDEYLVGQRAHTYKYEGGGAAVLGSVQPQPVDLQADGTFDFDVLASYVKPTPNGYHFARSKLLCIENTHDGKVLPLSYLHEARAFADQHGLGHHLDGARMWNAVIALETTPAEVAAPFDTVSVCLSKGLGAPVGSVLVGSAELVEEARRWRKMLGGGMRQAGVIAAAGRHAVDHHLERLADDHANAERLATGIADIPGLEAEGPFSNMVFLRPEGIDPEVLSAHLLGAGIVTIPGPLMRMVCHLDVSTADVDTVLAAMAAAVA